MTSSTIALPSSFTDNVLTMAGNLFSSWGIYIAMIVGVLLAALVIEIIIGAIKK